MGVVRAEAQDGQAAADAPDRDALGADRWSECHKSGRRTGSNDLGEVLRLDASARGQEVCTGGWLTTNGHNTKVAPGFSVKLTRSTAPWAFVRGEPFRTTASLEPLGALVGAMVLLPLALFDRSKATA